VSSIRSTRLSAPRSQTAHRLSMALLLAVAGATLPSAATAESARREIAGPLTFIHPIDQKWVATPAWIPTQLRFYGMASAVVGSEMFFYVGGGSYGSQGYAVNGPGGECPREDVMIFSVPNTHAGLRGTAGITYRGPATPCDNAHYTLGTVFRDPSRGNRYFLLATRSAEDSGCPTAFCQLYVGESADGLHWTWSTLARFSNGLSVVDGLHVLPDPARPGVWFGAFEFGPPGSIISSTGFVRVNWNTGLLDIATSLSPLQFRSYPIGSSITDSFTPAVAWATRTNALAKINGGFELWSIPGTPRSGDDPCAGGQPTPVYVNNTQTTPQGNRPQYRTLTPDFALGPVRQVVAAVPPVRPMPSDYDLAYAYPFTLNDPNGKQLLYTATRDPLICTVDYSQINDGFRGLGYVVTTLEDVP
jgi:hypothetical protein